MQLQLPSEFRCSSSERLAGEGREKSWRVSNYGRCRDTRGFVSFGSVQRSGYCVAQISGSRHYVHRLVAFAFLGAPSSELAWQVHHRDGNPSNNCLENLEYVTPSENVRHSFADFSRRNAGKSSSRPVMWRPIGSQSWTTSPSMTQAAVQLRIDCSTVSRACSLKTTAKGFEFQMAQEKDIAVFDEEEWRPMRDPVSGAEVIGREVSSLGRIRAQNGRISWGCQTKMGYYVTGLCLDSGRRTELVHRLVAFAFLGPPANSQHIHVNHKDMDRGNNSAQNLEYVTPAENAAHRAANRIASPRSDGKPIESRPFCSNDEWQWHPSMLSAASALGVQSGNISKCVKQSCKHTGGFEFRLAQSEAAEMCADEEWRVVDVEVHLRDRASRKKAGAALKTIELFKTQMYSVFLDS